MVPGPRAGVGGPGAERGSPGPPAPAHPQPPFQLSDLSAGRAHVWPGWRGPRKLCAGGDAAPACPTGRAAGGRKEEPSGKEPNCSPSLCLAGPHKGPAPGEAQLCGSWAGPNPTCPARGHIQAERWGQRHHARDPLRSGRGGVSQPRLGASCDVGGPQPLDENTAAGREALRALRAACGRPHPKTSNKTRGNIPASDPLTAGMGLPDCASVTLQGLAPAAPGHPAHCPAQACAHCPPVAQSTRGEPPLQPGPDPALHQAAPPTSVGPAASTWSHTLAIPPGASAPNGRSEEPGPGWGDMVYRRPDPKSQRGRQP